VVTSPWFRSAFPRFDIASSRVGNLRTTDRGYRYSTSIGGAVTGWGADLIVIDDPIKGLDAALSPSERRRVAEFYDGSLYTRLNNKAEGAIVIVMQRLHQDDLVGHVLDKEDWRVLSIPAIAPEDTVYRLGEHVDDVYRRRAGEVLQPSREPLERLEVARRTLGTLNFSAQYLQDPLPAAGNIIKRDWIRRYDRLPETFERKIASWDTASTTHEQADWSVGTVWGAVGQNFYLIDVVRERLEAPDLRHRMVRVAHEHTVDVTIVEDTELGRSITQDLRWTRLLFPILNPVRFSKEARFLAQSARFEAGQVYLPREASWLPAYESELLAFPTGRHDDQVDSTSQALHWLTARTPVQRERPHRRPRPPGRWRTPRRSGPSRNDLPLI
jgi:predicted phage terminase large subunit-like protein